MSFNTQHWVSTTQTIPTTIVTKVVKTGGQLDYQDYSCDKLQQELKSSAPQKTLE